MNREPRAKLTGDEMLLLFRQGILPRDIAKRAACTQANVYSRLRQRGVKFSPAGKTSMLDMRAAGLADEISQDLAGSKETMTLSELVEWLGSDKEDIARAVALLFRRDRLAVSFRQAGALVEHGGSLL